MTLEDVQSIVTEVVRAWNENPANEKLWVLPANPGDFVSIPNFYQFQPPDKTVSGATIDIRGFIIVIRSGLVLESVLSTFFHELGHVKHRQSRGRDFDPIESEVWAIRCSLESLEERGYSELAYREADAVKEMAVEDPYRSAVELLKDDPLWQKYSRSRASS